jgi:hypothetical protein
MSDWLEANRAMWDERVPIGAVTPLHPRWHSLRATLDG